MKISNRRRLILLGPQDGSCSSLQSAMKRLKLKGRVALITAGWEEDEINDEALIENIPLPVTNLNLFQRSEKLFREDPELIQLLRERQDQLRELRDRYNGRLNYLLASARETVRQESGGVAIEPEIELSIDVLKQMDSQILRRTGDVCDRFEEKLQTALRPKVAEARKELESILADSSALLISGGHAAIILNRLKIFGVLEMNPRIPILAWSGGAMALAEQIVFFHDSPPQGQGNPEVLRAGMGCFRDLLPLPDARTRLKLEDEARVELFARRFDRYRCVIFDQQTILDRKNGRWHASEQTMQLGTSGKLQEVQIP